MQQRPDFADRSGDRHDRGTKQETGAHLRIGVRFAFRNHFPKSPFHPRTGRRECRFTLEERLNMKGDKGSSAGARHGSNATDTADRDPKSASGLNERTGEFNVGEKIIFGMRNGNVLIRHSPQGDEVEVAEATLAGLIVDAFFSDGKLGDKYQPVQNQA
jgi:hypothetical protein